MELIGIETREKGEVMEQNCAVWITVVFLVVVMGLGFLFSAGKKDTRRSKETDYKER